MRLFPTSSVITCFNRQNRREVNKTVICIPLLYAVLLALRPRAVHLNLETVQFFKLESAFHLHETHEPLLRGGNGVSNTAKLLRK